MCSIANAGILFHDVTLLHNFFIPQLDEATSYSATDICSSLSVFLFLDATLSLRKCFVLFFSNHLSFLEGERFFLLWLLPLSLPSAHWPVKLEQFTTTNPLRTAANSENVLWFPANTIYLFSGSSCLWGKIKRRAIFSCFYLWITLSSFMRRKTKTLQTTNIGWKESAVSHTTNFLKKEEKGRELDLTWEN